MVLIYSLLMLTSGSDIAPRALMSGINDAIGGSVCVVCTASYFVEV